MNRRYRNALVDELRRDWITSLVISTMAVVLTIGLILR